MRIQKLPDILINKIAAGEVIERPASVVKELLENALDARATEIEIAIEQAGQQLIRIADNGIGMTREEAELALERHATSKIASLEDLEAIDTFGFRGEAVPSIASISRFTLVTRPESELAGTEIAVEGGNILDTRETGAPKGTRIDVRDLFYNTPVRLKFLKRPATEFGHILDIVNKLIMLTPQVRCRLTHNNQEILNYPATDDPAERIAMILGNDHYRHLFPVAQKGETMELRGMIASPEFTKRTATSALHLFVNGRPVRDKTIHHAVMTAYGTLIDRGNFPVVVLDLRIPPEDLDVNVHPTKAEVRFRASNDVYRFVRRSIATIIDQVPWMNAVLPGGESGDGPVATGGDEEIYASLKERLRQQAMETYRAPQPSRRHYAPGIPKPEHPAWPETHRKPYTPSEDTPSFTDTAPRPILNEGTYSSLAVIGVLDRTYILAESPRGLVLIDQHAAHERVLYVRLKKQLGDKGISPSPLLIPITLDLPAPLLATAEAFRDDLLRAGFDIEALSGSTLAVKAVPGMLEHRIDPANLLSGVLEELADAGLQKVHESALDLVLATTACHSAIRAHDPLSRQECEDLLRQMDETERSGYCPHGRPVMTELTLAELERLFHRR